MTSSRRLTWEEIAFFPDCATAGLGDARLVGDEEWWASPEPFLRRRRSGYGMIYGRVEWDGIPIEIGRVGKEVVAARIEFTHDVAKLEASGKGRWTPLGRLRVGVGGAVAVDPKQHHDADDAYCHAVPLPAGWYTAEAFETKDDHLGVRLRKE